MKKRTFLGECGRAAMALLVLMSGADAVLGQEQVWMEAGTDTALDISLGAMQAGPVVDPQSSVEEGQTPLDDSFDWRQFRLEKRRGALKDTKFEINLRTFYFDRNQFNGSESQAWAIGGWAGVKTGYFLDHIAFGSTLYTSQPLYAPKDRSGSLLLLPNQDGYTVLGEFYADIRIIDGLNVNVGAKGYDTPFINRNDTRMTPNTFEAIVLQGRTELGKASTNADESDTSSTGDIAGLSKDAVNASEAKAEPDKDNAVLKYGAGYFYQIKERNDSVFVSMAVDAGANVDRGVYTAGLLYEKGGFSVGGIDYLCPDVINIAYAESKLKLPIGADWQPKLNGQFVQQHSIGADLLQGDSFSGTQFGLKLDLPVTKALLLTAAATYAWGDTNLQNPWSGYPGYTSVQVQDFNRAGEGAFLLRAGYEFPWVEGLSAYALGVFGTTPDLGGQYRQNEYDLNLQYSPKKGRLKDLSFRLRYALVHQYGGNVDNLTDFRAICNYVITF
jgi:outer membrane porin, OprD family